MLFIYGLLEKTDSMEKTQAQAWMDRIALKGVSPGGQRRSLHGCQDTWEGRPCLGGIRSSVSQRQGNIYDSSSRGSVWLLLLI